VPAAEVRSHGDCWRELDLLSKHLPHGVKASLGTRCFEVVHVDHKEDVQLLAVVAAPPFTAHSDGGECKFGNLLVTVTFPVSPGVGVAVEGQFQWYHWVVVG